MLGNSRDQCLSLPVLCLSSEKPSQHQGCPLAVLARQRGTSSQASWPPGLSAIGGATRHQQKVDQPPALLVLYFGDNTGVGKYVGPHPRLQLGGEVNSLANNEVQKTYDE